MFVLPLRSPVSLLTLLATLLSLGQSVGPLDPSFATNDASIGSTLWSNPTSSFTNNSSYATAAPNGITRYLATRGFGFSIASPSNISGIQLEVDRSTSAPNAVALLNGWSTGTTKTISAGSNRCLIVAYAQENGNNTRDITAMTYGGRAMTQVAERTGGNTNNFTARTEVWRLLEADIALASSTNIVATYGAFTSQEYCEVFSSAVFQHVDQLVPVASQQSTGAMNPASTANPHQLGSAISTLGGSMVINVVTEGNNTTPASTNGGTNTYAINSGYTEGTDIYFANTSLAPSSGACFQTAHKAIATAGTEQPSCTFAGSVNRWAMIGFTLQRAREVDHRVQLIQGGVVGGSDLSSPSAWPTTDAYSSYGGPSELWGRTWTTSDINSINFGAALSARVQNGTARVDHVRITVYSFSTLPVELLYFRATPDEDQVHLEWATGTELNNDHFVIQRSADAEHFEDLERSPGAGTTSIASFYSSFDGTPLHGTSYYRLVQVDTDGTTDTSPVVAVTRAASELVLYPNPVEDTFYIHDPEARTFQVEVLDGSMRIVKRSSVISDSPMDLLRDLPDGTYTLLLTEPKGTQALRALKVSRER